MSERHFQSNNQKAGDNQKAGESYGLVARKRHISSLILSEIMHRRTSKVPKHSHELAYFALVLKGNYAEKFANKSCEYSPETILWHQPGVSHKYHIGKNGGHIFTIEIQPKSLEHISQFSKIPVNFFEQGTSLVGLGRRLYQELKNWDLCSELIVESITLEMLAYSTRKQFSSERRPPAWLLRVVEKINEEFRENLSIKDLACEAKVHPAHLATVFRQFYRQSPGEYLQRLRTNHVIKLLSETKIPLVEVAYSAGFSDQSHMTRIFKRHVGTTPGAFRNVL